ncbi:hypothetical protein [Streptomyces sp. NPDC048720]|uniref:hypothetical protein n=1 Tax=Streptomyces sp. NPDC048720 TaxID=3365588 RepID=UPI003715704E
MPAKHVFGIDPGEVNTGFVWIKYDTETKTGDTKIMHIYDRKGLNGILKTVWGLSEAAPEGEKPEIHFAVENFRVNSNQDPRKKTWFWDEVKTIRVIGAIELAAEWAGASITLQEPANVLPMARKWAPFKMAQHPKDDQSAWCHAVAFMLNKRWIFDASQITLFGQGKLT